MAFGWLSKRSGEKTSRRVSSRYHGSTKTIVFLENRMVIYKRLCVKQGNDNNVRSRKLKWFLSWNVIINLIGHQFISI